MWATFATNSQEQLSIKFLCKFSLDFLIPESQANLSINPGILMDWLGLLESENLQKTCTKTPCKAAPVIKVAQII